MARLLARAARWSLPVALIVATLVAAGGLGSMLFAPTPDPSAAPAALDLSRGAGPGTTLVPQDLPGARPGCPPRPSTPCPSTSAGPAQRTLPVGCCP